VGRLHLALADIKCILHTGENTEGLELAVIKRFNAQ
jgi:hypothetical protein